MKRSLDVASAAGLTPVLIAAAPATPIGSAKRAPDEAGRLTFDSSGGTVYVCDGSGGPALAHS
jgi:hypothetical protein